MFLLVCVLLAGLALFGLGRVMLAAKATEASMQAGTLRADIKSARLAGDMLEVDRSALTVPGRIEGIAGTSMKMSEAASIEYLSLPQSAEGGEGQEQVEAAVVAVQGGSPTTPPHEAAEGGVSRLVASLMYMAAGEAQVLLVGDVGLASSE